MNQEAINHAVRGKILQILDQCKGYPLTERALHNQIAIELEGFTVTTEQLAQHLAFLRDHGFVDFSVQHISAVKRWSITTAGRDEFRAMQYEQ